MYEFTNMAENYKTIIETDLLENYFNSIILLENSEFNYMISYYYNYFNKLIDKYYKYIVNKISSDSNTINEVIEEKKLEIKNNFNNIFQIIDDSQSNYLKVENQLKILHINETDFFQVKHLLNESIKELTNSLEDLINEIFTFEMFLPSGDKYSLVMRFYLENKELGKMIEKYYEPLDRNEFLYLNLGKFKDIMLENWIFESEDFVNILNKALSETNKEIKDELNIKLIEYRALIENELKNFFDG